MAPNRVNATETSVEILAALADLGSAGVTELANEVDGSKANVHKHLTTLEAVGLVRGTDGVYALGYRFLDFANAVKRAEPVYREGRPHLAKLADVSGATATFVVRDGLEGVYLHTVAPTGAAADAPADGERAPLHELAGGLAILSCFPDARQRAMLSDLVDADRVDALQDRLETIGQRGTAVRDDGDSGPQEVVAPVTTADGDPVAAVGLWQPTTGDESPRVETDLRKLVRNTAVTVSNRLSLTR